MLPQPRRTKYRKEQKGRNRGLATTGNSVAFGEFGLKSIELGNLSYRQLEAARRAMSRHVKKVRMGNGKGSVEFYVAQVRPGTVIFEISGVNEDFAREIFKKAGAKLPVKTVVVAREIGA
jgi:large subunit ribosomal protein L16